MKRAASFLGAMAVGLAMSTSASSAVECNAALKQLNNAVTQAPGAQVKSEIAVFKSTTDCNDATSAKALQNASAVLAQRAQKALSQGDLDAAESWLDLAPSLHWLVQVSRADIAAKQNNRMEAARQYNAALDTIMDPVLTPEQETLNAIAQKVAQLAQENTMLAGTLEGTVKRGGDASGVYKALTRGIVFEVDTGTTTTAAATSDTTSYGGKLVQKVFLPIRFEFDSAHLNDAGETEARRLADYIKVQNIHRLSLIGHTDDKGTASYNQDLSERRADKLAVFLKSVGVTAEIYTVGKGETDPPVLSDVSLYNDEQRRAIARRVELSLNY